jgi:hypothetical protein
MPSHFGYPWQVGPVTINLLADLFSLLDARISF